MAIPPRRQRLAPLLLCAVIAFAAASSAHAMPNESLGRDAGDVAGAVAYEFVDPKAAYKASFQSGDELEGKLDPVPSPKPDSGTPGGISGCVVKAGGASGSCPPVPEPVMPLLVGAALLALLTFRAGFRLDPAR